MKEGRRDATGSRLERPDDVSGFFDRWSGLDDEPPPTDALRAPQCHCAQPLIVEDLDGSERCARCGHEPRSGL